MHISICKAHKFTCVILIPVLALLACTPMGAPVSETPEIVTTVTQEAEPSATMMPSLTPTPTPTKRPSITPTSTRTPGPSPTPAPTPRFGAGKVGNDFLFGNQPDGCKLPCWQGLVIGESDAEDVQRMFEEAFDFGGKNAPQPRDAFVDAGISGLLRLSHQWTLDADFFFVSTLIQRNPHVLEAILLYGVGDRFEPYTSPQRILRSMGVPSHMLFRTQVLEVAGWYGSELLISYDEGVTIYYSLIQSRVTDQPDGVTLELCLGNLLGTYSADVYITPPIERDDIKTIFSPLKYAGLHTEKISPYFKPLEDVFGMSLEDVTKLAQDKDNACIYAKLPY